MAKVVVARKRQIQNALIPLAISVNGVEQDGLRSGGRIELDLNPGQHHLLVGNDRTLTFDNSSGEETHIRVWVSTFTSRSKIRLV